MKKPSARIRDEIAKLQEQLKQAETREAERIGRIALKAGLGDIAVEDAALVAAFEEMAVRFRKGSGRAGKPISSASPAVASGAAAGSDHEA
jgi:hypothetical protein